MTTAAPAPLSLSALRVKRGVFHRQGRCHRRAHSLTHWRRLRLLSYSPMFQLWTRSCQSLQLEIFGRTRSTPGRFHFCLPPPRPSSKALNKPTISNLFLQRVCEQTLILIALSEASRPPNPPFTHSHPNFELDCREIDCFGVFCVCVSAFLFLFFQFLLTL